MESILFSVENEVARISLNRPDVFNSFNREMALALHLLLQKCRDDEEIRAVYLTGMGKAFCAGQDLAEAIDENGPGIQRIVSEHYNPIIKFLRDIPKPVVAAVNGVAAGAGANIALACDIVVATESASFIQAFSKIGLVPDSGGTWVLPRIIGLQKATALAMLGDKVSANEAERIGMIYKVFSDEAFQDASWAIAAKLAKMPTQGLALTKQLLNMTFDNTLETQLDLEELYQATAGQTHDYQEGVQAFLEKRKPEFKGK